jgi:flagellar hook protein FlgE
MKGADKMLRSMYSGISGMKNFQTKLDVIGNNIANVNTYGFKKGRVVFKDMMSQTISGASSSAGNRGGVNPKQIGLGSQLATIDTITEGGSLQTTNRVLDLAVSGDGYFQVGSSDLTAFTNVQYTRAGNTFMDENGYLVNSDGLFLGGFSAYSDVTDYDHDNNGDTPAINKTVGITPADVDASQFNFSDSENPVYDGDTVNVEYPGGTAEVAIQYKPIKIPTDAQSMSIGKDGTVTYIDSEGQLKWAGKVVLANFATPGGLQKSGNNLYQQTNNSGAPIRNFAGEAGIGTTESGFLEMSNVDLSEEFSEMIVAQRGFQANSRIITTSDEILQELVNLKR